MDSEVRALRRRKISWSSGEIVGVFVIMSVVISMDVAEGAIFPPVGFGMGGCFLKGCLGGSVGPKSHEI